jgi:hypothetical protein
MTTFKIFFGVEVRRFTVPEDTNYSQFLTIITNIHDKFKVKDWIISYRDREGDTIFVSSEVEWREMMSELATETVKKIRLEDLIVVDSDKIIDDFVQVHDELPVFSEVEVNEVFEESIANDFLKFADENIVKKVKELVELIMELYPDLPQVKSYLESTFESGIQNLKDLFSNVDITKIESEVYKVVDEIKKMVKNEESSNENECINSSSSSTSTLSVGSSSSSVSCENETLIVSKSYSSTENDIVESLDPLNQPNPFLRESDLCQYDKYSQLLKELESDRLNPFSKSQSLNEEDLEKSNDGPVILEYDTLSSCSMVENDSLSSMVEDKGELSISLGLGDIRSKWSSEIKQLKDFGFYLEEDVLALIIEQHDGNLSEVANFLLTNSHKFKN